MEMEDSDRDGLLRMSTQQMYVSRQRSTIPKLTIHQARRCHVRQFVPKCGRVI